ncbi:DUF2322 family protein [Acidithiobacillus sp.]
MSTPVTTLPSVAHVRKLLFYGGPLSQLVGDLENRPEQEHGVAVLYHLALRYGVISPTAAREGLALLGTAGSDGDATRKILEEVIAQGDFLAVRVLR